MISFTRKVWHTVCCTCTVIECVHNANANRCVRGYHITDHAGTCLTCRTMGAHGGGMRRGKKPTPPGAIMTPILMGHA